MGRSISMARLGVVGLAVLSGLTVLADESLRPFTLSASDPDVFAAPDVKVLVAEGDRLTKNRGMGLSSDKQFRSGLFSSGAGRGSVDFYPVDEFMYFTGGSMTLTSHDGTVTKLKPGVAVFIPKGWKGKWETVGYTKFYSIYEPLKN